MREHIGQPATGDPERKLAHADVDKRGPQRHGQIAWFGTIPVGYAGDGPTPVSLFLLVIGARRLGQRMQKIKAGQ